MLIVTYVRIYNLSICLTTVNNTKLFKMTHVIVFNKKAFGKSRAEKKKTTKYEEDVKHLEHAKTTCMFSFWQFILGQANAEKTAAKETAAKETAAKKAASFLQNAVIPSAIDEKCQADEYSMRGIEVLFIRKNRHRDELAVQRCDWCGGDEYTSAFGAYIKRCIERDRDKDILQHLSAHQKANRESICRNLPRRLPAAVRRAGVASSISEASIAS